MAPFESDCDVLEERVTASFLYGAARLHHDLGRLVPVTLGAALETWRRGSSLGGVLDIVREIRERKIKSFFHFSSHLPLTFMFLSAKMGDLDAAQTELETYAREHKLAEDVLAKLTKFLRDLAPNENARSQS